MKYIKNLFTPATTGILFVIFAIAMAAATFIENDYGTPAAFKFVYGARWFELILVLLSVNLIGQLIVYKMFRKEKLAIAIFHLSFVIMIMGAGITRYFGWEGMMHIREGESQNMCYSSHNIIRYELKDNTGKTISSFSRKYNLSSISADNFKKSLNIGNQKYSLELSRIIPNAEATIVTTPNGEPIISMTVTKDMTAYEVVTLRRGEKTTVFDVAIGFEVEEVDINIKCEADNFYTTAEEGLSVTNMMQQDVQEVETPDGLVQLSPMQVLTFGGLRIVPQIMDSKGSVRAMAVNPRERATGQKAFIFNLANKSDNSDTKTVILWDIDYEHLAAEDSINVDGNVLTIRYGAEEVTLPFSIKLNKFILERYPGSNSPSGYKSDVTLINPANGEEKPYMIFMNNILKYKGYRFYQSSYDHDEQGTILSVNRDFAGTFVTYTGYAVMIIFIMLALLSKKSLFRTVNAGHWKSLLRKTAPVLLFFIISGLSEVNAQKLIPDKKAAEEFGGVLVQDEKGRTKPLYTLSSDILRKVTRKNKFEGMTPMQVFLGISFDFHSWENYPLIRISNDELKKMLGVTGNFIRGKTIL